MKNFLPPSLVLADAGTHPTIRTPDFFQTNPTPETITLRQRFDIQIESCSRLIATK